MCKIIIYNMKPSFTKDNNMNANSNKKPLIGSDYFKTQVPIGGGSAIGGGGGPTSKGGSDVRSFFGGGGHTSASGGGGPTSKGGSDVRSFFGGPSHTTNKNVKPGQKIGGSAVSNRKLDFVIEELEKEPLEIPTIDIDNNPKPKRKRSPCLRSKLDSEPIEIQVPISSKITSPKRKEKILRKKGKDIQRAVRDCRSRDVLFLNSNIETEDNSSISDISLDSSFEERENLVISAGGGGPMSTYVPEDEGDDEDSIATEPDIPEKFTERQVPDYSKNVDPLMEKKIKIKNRRFQGSWEIKLMEQPIYQNQKDTAKGICDTFKNKQKVIQMIIARTQTGKAGCMLEFISQYIEKFQIPVEHIFIISTLSSTDWKEQMKQRAPEDLEKRIFHLNDLLSTFKNEIEGKKNVLILIDEPQCAAGKDQTMYRLMSENNLNWNLDTMFENDIKIVQFSATPDGLIMALRKKQWPRDNYEVHMMPEGPGYYGIKQMLNRPDRKEVLKQSKDICGRKSNGEWEYDGIEEEIEQNIMEIYNDIDSFSEPKYHILRASGCKYDDVKENLLNTADKHLRRTNRYDKFDFNNIKEYIQDGDIEGGQLNELLKVKPKKQTLIFIKEKLKCADTIIKDHIGVVYERISKNINDTFIIQGLLGRITGYGHHDIICYTNLNTIDRYEKLFESNFSEDGIRESNWNSNTTKRSKRGTKSKKTYIDPTIMLAANEEENEKNNAIWEKIFDNEKDAKKWCKEELINKNNGCFGLYNKDGNKYKSAKSVHETDNVFIKYRSEKARRVVSYETTINMSDLYSGVSKEQSRVYPVIVNNKIKYVVMYNKENKK